MKILGGEIDLTIDGGAYATLSSVVLSRATIMLEVLFLASGEYARGVATDTPPHGAFRDSEAAEPLRHGTSHGPHRERRWT